MTEIEKYLLSELLHKNNVNLILDFDKGQKCA